VGSAPLSPSTNMQTRLRTSATAPLNRVAAHWAFSKSTVCKLQRAPCAWCHATGIGKGKGKGKTAADLPGNCAFQSRARPRAACTDLCIGLSTGFATASVDNLPKRAT